MYIYGSIFYLVCKRVGEWPRVPCSSALGFSTHMCMVVTEQRNPVTMHTGLGRDPGLKA